MFLNVTVFWISGKMAFYVLNKSFIFIHAFFLELFSTLIHSIGGVT